ncbi:beta strand repeat-containing protein [Chryseobacterium scophthalmum]|uniref:beta strand repeat-containing protein n=1 Tax=Chryseobacterium scophthalmum TaxID=59733 RepID=UPI001AEC44D8|nr:hypothetical protein [Chryseobacterium scophthalmum]
MSAQTEPSDDFDGDGIINSLDLDDDNDGVPDVSEMGSCSSYSNLGWTGDSPVGTRNITANGLPTYITNATGTTPFTTGPALTVSSSTSVNYFTITGVSTSNDFTTAATAGSYLSFNFQTAASIPVGLAISRFVQASPVPGGAGNYPYSIAYQISQNGSPYTTVATSSVTYNGGTFTGNFTSAPTPILLAANTSYTIRAVLYNKTSANATVGFDNFNISFCNVFLDTDGDTIPNYFDLDSDGDGCSDALEAGATADTTPNYQFSGAVGSNGLNDSLETVTDSGVVNYNSTYFFYAISSVLNLCTDTDGDGIKDIFDLDDDNDGVLDAVESPSCFFTAAEMAIPNTVSTEIPTAGAIANLYDNNSATTFAFTATTAPNALDKSIFEITPSLPLAATSIILNLNTTTSPIAALSATATLKAQGWNGTLWVDLATYTATQAPVSNVQTFAFASNTAVYSKYRLFESGTTGVAIGTNAIQEVKFGLPAAYNPSANPKPLCADVNIDNDGVPPHRDLDTDGDGCSDSVEAGNTIFTSNNTTTFNTGTDANNNGLLDQFESGTTGTINYTSTYTSYATDVSVSACLDSDGDGVADIVDIDDDNDGILDIYEQKLFSCENTFGTENKLINWTLQNSNTATGSLSLNGETVNVVATTTKTFAGLRDENWGFGSGAYTGCPGSGDVAPNSAINIFSNDYTVTYTFSKPVKNPSLSFSSYNGVGVSFSQPVYVSGLQGTVPTLNIGDYISSFPGTENTVSVIYHGVYNSISFTLTGADNQGATMLFIPEIKPTGTATYVNTTGSPFGFENVDTDGDGIFNHLDLDSDGDGCPDAQESGVTGTLLNGNVVNTSGTVNTANAIAQGPYGSNGLANPLENNDTGSATTSFSSTYNNYALFNSLNNCIDTDNDGVKDLIDIDDDNDGVVDAVESPTCFYTQAEAGIIVSVKSSLSSPDDDQQDGDIQILHDGATTLTFNYTAGQAINGASLIIVKYPTAIQLSQLSLVNNTTFGVGVTARLEGSQDAITWTDLGNGNVALDNTTNPKLFNNTNTGRYQYYRVLGTAGGNTVATTTIGEVNFVLAPFTTSLHPKSTCTQDTDGDGFLNHLDLDSDGDGCPDAVEAGVSINAGASGSMSASGGSIYTGGILSGTANAYVGNGTPSQYGANGYFNSIETSSESGIYNGTLTYSQYALANNLSVCADTDGDGINDIVDIDDDNDGVLDAVESPGCFYTASEIAVPQSVTTQIANTGVIANVYDNNVATTFTFTNGSTKVNLTVFDITPLSAVKAANVFVRYSTATANALGTTANSVTIDGWNGTSWVTLQTYTPAAAVANVQTFAIPAGSQATYTKYRLQGLLTTVTNAVITEVGLTAASDYNPSAHPKSTCGADFDGDGIFNHLDSDSDNDGCSDAFEAGTVAYASANGGTFSAGTLNNPSSTLSPNATVGNNTPADYGANGFYNILETSENGVYLGTYTYANAINALIANCTAACYKPAITAGTVLDTKQGITSLKRAGSDNDNWPMVRKGAWTALESKTKGFVPNRLTITQINAIPAANLREGMMVYNISSDCLYINTDGTATGWKCFNTQACP